MQFSWVNPRRRTTGRVAELSSDGRATTSTRVLPVLDDSKQPVVNLDSDSRRSAPARSLAVLLEIRLPRTRQFGISNGRIARLCLCHLVSGVRGQVVSGRFHTHVHVRVSQELDAVDQRNCN